VQTPSAGIGELGAIAHHQVGLRSRQHRLDIRRIGAVTTGDAVVFQQPDVAGPSDGLIGDIRDAVGIDQTARPQTGQDLFKPARLEADHFAAAATLSASRRPLKAATS
jgi:hypothetical protein